jgi:hypothetical protein
MQISIGGALFHVETHGFGAHAAVAAAAIRRLEITLTDFSPRQLNDPAVLDEFARLAVHHETVTWSCWRPGYRGEVPRLVVRRAEARGQQA